MKKLSMLFVLLFLSASATHAHFGMVIPSDSMVMQGEDKSITIQASFSHPFELVGMNLVKPKVFNVMANGSVISLLGLIEKNTVLDHMAWSCVYKIKRPGVYMFYMEPQPYWEPAEDCYIIHYTKSVVTAFGDDEGWDRELGLKTEIVPLSKPYGLYAGNVFQGIVKMDKKPVAFCDVEVEFYNAKGKAKAPTDYMVTQTIKTDANGVFTYSTPVSGWWGFAALNSADYQISYNGKDRDVELGAVIWVKFHDWQK